MSDLLLERLDILVLFCCFILVINQNVRIFQARELRRL